MSAISAWSSMVAAGSHIRPPLDTDVLTWAAAVVTAGGTVSAARKALISDFVWHEKKAGCWDLTDDYWMLAAENATQALVSLKQLRTATEVSAPTFEADRGYTGDGAASYINTGFVPSAHAVSLAVESARMAVYERSNVASAGMSMGTQTAGGTSQMRLLTRNASDAYQIAMVSNAAAAGTVTDGRGFTAMRRLDSASPVWNIFKSGSAVANSARTAAAALPDVAIFILALNANGVASSLRASQMAFGSVGAALSDAQERAQYVNVQTLLAAIGAAV